MHAWSNTAAASLLLPVWCDFIRFFLGHLAFHCKSLYNSHCWRVWRVTLLGKNVNVKNKNKNNPDVCTSTESPHPRGKIDVWTETLNSSSQTWTGLDQRTAPTFRFVASPPHLPLPAPAVGVFSSPPTQSHTIRCRSIFHLSHLQPIGLMVGSGAWLANKEAGWMELVRRALRWWSQRLAHIKSQAGALHLRRRLNMFRAHDGSTERRSGVSPRQTLIGECSV